jgi:hypothetical protein
MALEIECFETQSHRRRRRRKVKLSSGVVRVSNDARFWASKSPLDRSLTVLASELNLFNQQTSPPRVGNPRETQESKNPKLSWTMLIFTTVRITPMSAKSGIGGSKAARLGDVEVIDICLGRSSGGSKVETSGVRWLCRVVFDC